MSYCRTGKEVQVILVQQRAVAFKLRHGLLVVLLGVLQLAADPLHLGRGVLLLPGGGSRPRHYLCRALPATVTRALTAALN